MHGSPGLSRYLRVSGPWSSNEVQRIDGGRCSLTIPGSRWTLGKGLVETWGRRRAPSDIDAWIRCLAFEFEPRAPVVRETAMLSPYGWVGFAPLSLGVLLEKIFQVPGALPVNVARSCTVRLTRGGLPRRWQADVVPCPFASPLQAHTQTEAGLLAAGLEGWRRCMHLMRCEPARGCSSGPLPLLQEHLLHLVLKGPVRAFAIGV